MEKVTRKEMTCLAKIAAVLSAAVLALCFISFSPAQALAEGAQSATSQATAAQAATSQATATQTADEISVLAVTPDYAWYKDSKTSTFEISTEAELVAFANIVNGTATSANIAQSDFAGKTINLTSNVKLSGNFTPIGNAAHAFKGTFNGNYYAITGLSVAVSTGYAGLFGNNAGTIANFTLEGSVKDTGASKDFVGGVAGYNSGTISGIKSTVSVSASNDYNVGGIAGFNDGGYNAEVSTSPTGGQGKIINCSTSSNRIEGNQKVGGIAGENSGEIKSCFSSSIVNGTNTGRKNGVGGIVGRNGNNNKIGRAHV